MIEKSTKKDLKKMEEELKNFIKVWVSAIISISYCYYIPTKIKPGFLRLLSVLPVCLLFLLLPLVFSSFHFSGLTGFFLSWLANFKLILFSFDQSPLFPLPPNLSQFICFTCFPIKPQQNPKLSQTHSPKWVSAIKVLIFTLLLHLYDYKQNLPPFLLLILYSLHIYLELELILMLVKVFIFISIGCEIEPQFNEPYLATSLQDFWGHRWNLMVPAILRPAVYNPVRLITQKWMKSDWAILLGVLASFLVSGALHELLFFYITRDLPTGEVSWFFVLHGVCTAVEVGVKRTALGRRWRVNVGVSRLLTVGFVVVTGGWLFFPQLIRSGMIERLANEALFSIDFVKRKFYIFGK